MKLIFIRHGDAGAYTLPDSERQLSALGQSQAMATGQWLAEHYTASQVITSPYHRARQTAQIVIDCQPSLSPLALSVCEHITPNDEAIAGLDAIARLIDDKLWLNGGVVVVVCHMNVIAKMVAYLTGESPYGFDLAEARVLDVEMMAQAVASLDKRFVPMAT